MDFYLNSKQMWILTSVGIELTQKLGNSFLCLENKRNLMLAYFTGHQKGQQRLTLIYKKPNSNQLQHTTDGIWWPFELLKGKNEPPRVCFLPPLLLARGDCSSSHRHSPPRPRRTHRTFLTGTAGADGSHTAAARTCQGHHSSS